MKKSVFKLKFKRARQFGRRAKIVAIAMLAAAVFSYVYFRNIIIPVLYDSAQMSVEALASDVVNEPTFKFASFSGDGKSYFDYTVNGEGYITSVTTNNRNVNVLSRQIVALVQTEIDNNDSVALSIPLGNFTGINFIYGLGPDLSFNLRPIGSASCDFFSELTSCGVNQTLHRLYVTVTAQYVVAMPFRTLEIKYSTDYMVFENLIIGKVPETYLQMTGSAGNLKLAP